MSLKAFRVRLVMIVGLISICTVVTLAQSLNAGTVQGTVIDPNKAVVPNATVTIENGVTGYTGTVTTGRMGPFGSTTYPSTTMPLPRLLPALAQRTAVGASAVRYRSPLVLHSQ